MSERSDELLTFFVGEPSNPFRAGTLGGLVRACNRIVELEAELTSLKTEYTKVAAWHMEDHEKVDELTAEVAQWKADAERLADTVEELVTYIGVIQNVALRERMRRAVDEHQAIIAK